MVLDELSRTLDALESGLRVRDIATLELMTCRADELSHEVLENAELATFDQIPVKRNGSIAGVLERPIDPTPARTFNGASVDEVMRPLDDSLLVSAELPLRNFIKRIVNTRYHLVVVGADIAGVVTPSDTLKMPVRLLAFAFVAHLESRMASLIRTRSEGDDWTKLLDRSRLKQVERRAGKLSTDRMDPDLLELTLFSDKTQVVSRLLKLSEEEVRELKTIERMRNEVAHGADYAESDQELHQFVNTLDLAEAWIARLSE